MFRKVKRIFFRSLGALLLFVILAVIAFFFGIQSFAFQTWLGRKASGYLSSELGTKVYIHKINLKFFSKANLEGILILDKYNDTILQGNILVDLKKLDYKNKALSFDKITLKNVTSKLIKYSGDSTYNYSHLIDYFDSGTTDTTSKSEWKITLGDIYLENVAFVYRVEKFVTKITNNINFDDVWLKHTFAKVSHLKLDKDTIILQLDNFSAIEKSGFEVSKLNTKARISDHRLLCEDIHLKTPRTFVKGKIDFTYNSWDDYTDFIDKVKLDCYLLDSTYVSFTDIAAFTSELNGLNETVKISGNVTGYVSDMTLKNLNFSYRNHSHFKGNISLTGLPNINSTFIHFDSKEFSSNYYDLIHIPNYPFIDGKKIELPEEIKRLGTVSYRGKFDGFIGDFTTYGNFTNDLGKAKTELSVKLGTNNKDITYTGKISTENFNLGTLLGQNDFNSLTMNLEVKGRGINVKELKATLVGEVNSITYNNYNYNNIKLNGNISEALFNGLFTSKDPNADFDFNGTIDFKNKFPEMDFISTINALNLHALHFTNQKDSGILSSQIFLKVNGDNIDNLSGQINFDNTIYKTKTRTFKLSTFNIQMEQNSADKKIRLSAEYLNAAIYGRYNVSNLQHAFESFLNTYYPGYFKKTILDKKYKDELTFQIKIKKFKTINELFLPDVMVASGTIFDGNFNAAENKLNLQVKSPKFNYKDLFMTDLVLILNENQKTVLAELSGKSFHIADSLTAENFNCVVKSFDKEFKYAVDWDNLKAPSNKGKITGQINIEDSFFKINNEELSVTLNDSTWNLISSNKITIDTTGAIFIAPMSIVNKLQSINIAGALSTHNGDSLVIATENVVLEQFNRLLQEFSLKLEGRLNGNITLSNVNNNFAFNGDVNLTQLKINNNSVGQLQVNTVYFTKEKIIRLSGYTSLGITNESGELSKNISFKGFYYPEKKTESIDIDFAAKPANLRLLNPFLEGILEIKDGFVNGAGKVHGTPNKIKIDGKFRLFRSEVKVDYTNVTYNITGDIEVMPDQIRFSEMAIREKGTKFAQGYLNGNLFHTNFNKMQIDYDITYKNMLILNTTEKENKTFYGKVYGTGTLGIYGFINKLNMNIENTTNRNTKFYLPLDGPAEIGESDFIQFVKRDTTTVKKETGLTGFNLEMLIHATPDAQAQIIIDKAAGDVLNVQGQGDLKIKVNTLGKFEMTGDYVFTDGDYLFTLENVINKKFDIEAGSSISWSGNPLGAEIDVTASYKQRASIAPLLNDSAKTRTPVDCKLIITGKLFSPNINFEIDFPNISSEERSKINSVLSDEAELNRQVFSFLLFRTFTKPLIYNTNGGGVTAGGAAASTGSELLSNRVSEFLNTHFGTLTGIRDLQLGVNYRPGTQTSSETVDLALSKQFLDNKVSVDGNFGVNNNATNHNSNGLIGDVNIDYKLSADGRFRLKGFNKSNDNTQSTLSGGNYTQGVGLFYRLEFETLGSLYRNYLSKLKRKEDAKKN
ncbi:translocation/assembly module TamB domain-containing protein [Aurantibacillus circumpalustris]|uniref:translocation/assembly module TamB domain-containing protein n=1 Tax=Aurantibacillus circumpalustris TaxID=3036359 RepID=UPI00295B8155|nr:translocation/assembly module TamB domain-containing protein [Aurantibacillus circumpalustris]